MSTYARNQKRPRVGKLAFDYYYWKLSFTLLPFSVYSS
jgi:hypothetical protein